MKAVLDHYRQRGAVGELPEADQPGGRLDGKTCLLTGGSAGIGRALAVELLRRGAELLLAVRAGHEGLAEAVRRESGSDKVTQVPLDLADLSTVSALCDRLAAEGARLDLVISNAAVAPARNRKTKDGFDEIFQVNFLGAFLLLHRLLSAGTIPNRTFSAPPPLPLDRLPHFDDAPGGSSSSPSPSAIAPALPRIVITASEAHRTAPPIDFDPARFGRFPDFGLLDGTTWYGHSKLYVQTFACELGRRLSPGGVPDVAVFSYCPGAVRSRISREAGLAGRIMTSYFIAPEKAIWPAVYASVSRDLEGQSGRYFYLRQAAEPEHNASDPAAGAALWRRSLELLEGGGFLRPA